MPDRQFEIVLHRAGHKDRNLKGIAAVMNVPYPTLAEYLNPDIPAKQMKATDLPAFIEAADDNSPIEYLCRLRNLVCFPAPPDIPTLGEISRQVAESTREFGEMLTELSVSLSDGVLTDAERERCRQETYQVRQAVAALWVALGGNEPQV